jgi:hypothetical protein
VVGFWTSDDEICAETGGGEARSSLYLGHFALNIADTGKVDHVERILKMLVKGEI